MGQIDKWCPMCGAAPGEPCTVVSGGDGLAAGDVRPDVHVARQREEKPGVLIPDEPTYAYGGAPPPEIPAAQPDGARIRAQCDENLNGVIYEMRRELESFQNAAKATRRRLEELRDRIWRGKSTYAGVLFSLEDATEMQMIADQLVAAEGGLSSDGGTPAAPAPAGLLPRPRSPYRTVTFTASKQGLVALLKHLETLPETYTPLGETAAAACEALRAALHQGPDR